MPPTQPAASGKLSDAQLRAALALIEPRWAQPLAPRTGRADVATLERRLADTNPMVRAQAAALLGVLNATASTAKLKALLEDRFPPVRQAAASALLRLGDLALQNEFVKALTHDNPRIVAGAATALGESGKAAFIPYLLAAFRTTNPFIAAAIARALGALKARAALPWLIAALNHDFISAAAAEAIGQLADPSGAPHLLRALIHRDEDVRSAAARSLGLLSRATAHTPDALPFTNKLLPALRTCATDPSLKVRLCAAISRMELGDDSAAQLLRDTLEQAANSRLAS